MGRDHSSRCPHPPKFTAIVERIQNAVLEETKKNSTLAEQEWKRGAHGDRPQPIQRRAVVNLRPSAAGIEVQVRYVTRASERFDLRNRLYQKLMEVLNDPAAACGGLIRAPAGAEPTCRITVPVDTIKGFPLTLKSDAEPPPSRSPPSSWDLHAGGLPWPEVNGQRDQETPKPAGDQRRRAFCLRPKSNQNQEDNEQCDSNN